eukprot:764937-Hanusia_phi.AAC.1
MKGLVSVVRRRRVMTMKMKGNCDGRKGVVSRVGAGAEHVGRGPAKLTACGGVRNHVIGEGSRARSRATHKEEWTREEEEEEQEQEQEWREGGGGGGRGGGGGGGRGGRGGGGGRGGRGRGGGGGRGEERRRRERGENYGGGWWQGNIALLNI